MINKSISVLVLLLLASASSVAIEFDEGKLRLSGFGTVMSSKSDNITPYYDNRYITDERCNDCDTTFGLQLDYYASDSLRFSAQTVKRPQDTFSDVETEWAYLGFSPFENFEIRAGKLRLPLFLTSDYYYVGHAYPWVRPAPEVYNRLLGLNDYTGGEFVWDIYLGDFSLRLHPFYGDEKKNEVDRLESQWKFETGWIRGGALDIEGPNFRIHLAHMLSNVSLEKEWSPRDGRAMDWNFCPPPFIFGQSCKSRSYSAHTSNIPNS